MDYLTDLPNQLSNLPNKIPRTPQELINGVTTVQMAPYFLVVHYILVTLSLRRRSGSQDYAREHPFASLFVCIVSCLGGSIISNFLLGKPILHVFYLNSSNIILITIIWYLILFSPFDTLYKVINLKLITAVLLVLKEVHRVRNVQNGVDTVVDSYRGSSIDQIFFVAVLIGSVRGSGAKFILRPLDSFIRGNLISDNEFLQPTFSTKHSVVSSILILLQRLGYIQIEEPMLITALFLVAGAVQLAILLLDAEDPYKMVEKVFAAIFLRLPSEVSSRDGKQKSD